MTAHVPKSIAVVIPTFRRAEHLRLCLRALAVQTVPPNRIIVSIKALDLESSQVVDEYRSSFNQIECISSPASANFRDQLNAGILQTSEHVIAFTDDDAEPTSTWIDQILRHFDDINLAGVGGRDVLEHENGSRSEVGIVSWYGRVVGNHHLGNGNARPVDVLKGVNMAFRGDLLRAIRFDERLLGQGNVVHTELAVCLTLRRLGWHLLYDPNLIVKHNVAPRMDGDPTGRGGFEKPKYACAVHNETLALLDYFRWWQLPIFVIWGVLIGTSASPGVAQVIRLCVNAGSVSFQLRKFGAVIFARMGAIRTFCRSRDSLSRRLLPAWVSNKTLQSS